jgi:DUF177 domain-containing protein
MSQMKINVAQLLKEQSGHAREYELREDITSLDPEIVATSALTGKAQLIRTSDGLLVRGTLRTNLELNCSRCIDAFSMPVQFLLEEEFRPTIDIISGATLPRPIDDESATQIDAHHVLDLSEVIRQDLLLAIPTHPLCRSNCAGLCPECGQNLNTNPHQHAHDEIDPRLQVLQKLLEE